MITRCKLTGITPPHKHTHFSLSSLHIQLLAGILHLGNITFGPKKGTDGGSQILPAAAESTHLAAAFLMVSSDGLEESLCYRMAQTGAEIIKIPIDPEKAADQVRIALTLSSMI
jgi:myosin heavy subunit